MKVTTGKAQQLSLFLKVDECIKYNKASKVRKAVVVK